MMTSAHAFLIWWLYFATSSVAALDMNWEEKSLILENYNEFRADIAAGLVTGIEGSNMNELYWDSALSMVSSQHSENCVYESNNVRNWMMQSLSNNASWIIDSSNDASYVIGENLYAISLFFLVFCV